MNEEKNSLIGDYIGTIEEFVPGEGTYAEEGKIYAAKIGEAKLDRENHKASVDGKSIADIEVGNVVFGEVMMMRKNMAIVIVSRIQGHKQLIDARTMIYISNIADKYVEKPEDMFAVGDIVKAKVLKIDQGNIDISTKGEFGVVKSFCKRCRKPLSKSEKSPDRLECESCGNKETRKLASDYGSVKNL